MMHISFVETEQEKANWASYISEKTVHHSANGNYALFEELHAIQNDL